MTEVVDLRAKLGVRKPDEFEWINMLVYGESGAGKTRFVGTAADHEATRPLLLIDVEGGTKTLRGKDIDVKEIRSVEELDKIYTDIYNASTMGALPWKTIAIDSTSDLQQNDMSGKIMVDAYNKNPDKVEIEVPSPREYLISLSRMRKLFRGFRDLPCHTLFTSMSHSYTDKDSKVTYVKLTHPGKQAEQIPGVVDIVGLLRVESKGNQQIRLLQTAKTKTVMAKDRFDCLGGLIENPTIPLIWEKIANAA